ncbi:MULTISPECIES: ABC transporter permease [Actinoalloteichus]|uniref:Autoinducer 2 import system permease protein LsrD n=1 Tax=Actinoalloteichus fjordicus TaxID=1612552 RepID=A0AAC9LEH5_9PSEU|nr:MULTISPECIES: ABC transporter permease [Actinoalloteichus]APU16167.1 permease component of ribose/xylose/arabinose/galactoside ABC-type transporters [Actinoalloteichus fjordicus]APU22230.1 permease component of ribose/xylose/arabinose/galactoside ABC-type transporters [Actinoalloteichus sp. GBA129-24]
MSDTVAPEARRAGLRLPAALSASTPVFVLLGVLLIVLAFVDIGFYEPDRLLAFIRRAAPLIILAAGQYFVMVSGGFDLSVGSIVTVGVVVAAELFNIVPDMPWPVAVLILLVAGMVVGLLNGLVSTVLAVPSFITTLGMMLILQGAVFFWTQGAPRGYLSEGYRTLGRGMVPGLPWLPWAVVVLVVIAVAAVLFMRSDTGRTLVATGDNDAAAALSGVRVHRLRVSAFVLSGLAAAMAAVLVGGFTGISAQAGNGMEFEAITAVVLGGVALGGGRGSVVAAMAGALSLQTLFTLLTMLGVSGALESTVQGVIVIAAVALGAVSWSRRRRVPNSTKERR